VVSDGRRPARVAILATSTAAPAAPMTAQVSAVPPMASEPDIRAAARVLTASPIDTPTPPRTWVQTSTRSTRRCAAARSTSGEAPVSAGWTGFT